MTLLRANHKIVSLRKNVGVVIGVAILYIIISDWGIKCYYGYNDKTAEIFHIKQMHLGYITNKE